jgi:hypothetical protein
MRYRQIIYWTTVAHSVIHQQRLPYYYALGFPKSGTGWLSRIMVDYLGLPKLGLKHRRWPAFSPCVIKMHRFLKGNRVRSRTLYIVRDPRDVVVSYFWHVLRHGGTSQKDIEGIARLSMKPENIKESLPAVIEYLQSGRCGAIAYADHISKALTDGYVCVRYEDLLEDCFETLKEAFSQILEEPVDHERLQATVAKHTFEAETGRPRGVAAPDAYIRKGVAGDWPQYFSEQTARLLDDYCGETLIQLGYAADRSWVGRFAD